MANFFQAGFPYRRITNHLSTLMGSSRSHINTSTVYQLTCDRARLKKAPLQRDDDNTSLVNLTVHSAPLDTQVLDECRLEDKKTDTEAKPGSA